MRTIVDLARMELQKMFYSPIAWLILIILTVQSSILYLGIITSWVTSVEMGYSWDALTSRIYAGRTGFFTSIQNTLYLYIPLITMGLMSKEFSSGSIKLLYSSPVSNTQIVLGKYFAVLVFALFMIFILFIESVFGFITIKEFDFPQVLTGLLGMFLVIATYSAIGLFMSSLTSYQIVAAIGSFAAFFLLQQVGSMWQSLELVRDVTYWLSIGGRSQTFIQGLICSEDLLYFILVSGLFIGFTIFRLKGIREKSTKYVSFLRYAGVFVVVSLLGYITTIPSLMYYHDATRTKLNTLTENSQEVISKLKGKIKITTYVNAFGDPPRVLSPTFQKNDESRYEQYRRFYPNIDMDWKYYYAVPTQEALAESHYKRYKGMTDEEALNKICNIYDMDPEKVKPASEFKNEIDLEAELNRFVRKIETEDDRVAHLRIFDDRQKMPYESQQTAAFKALVEELPVVGFVNGHDERDVNDVGTRGYHMVAQEKPFRWSLKNNGFDFITLNLDSAVSPQVDILVIAEAKTAYSTRELQNLNEYIDRGGNLIIAADRRRQEAMNPLVQRLGITFQPGQVVEYNKGYTMDLITSSITEEAKKLAYQFDENVGDHNVTMPGAVALTYEAQPAFTYTPVMISDSIISLPKITDSIQWAALKKAYAQKGKQQTAKEVAFENLLNSSKEEENAGGENYKASWNELETQDFIDEVAAFNPEKGELGGPMTTALALTRKVGVKEQRIMVLGDADCFANGEISLRRKGIEAANFHFINGMFFWLSNEASPIDMRRPHNPDDDMLLKKNDMGFYSILYKLIIPSLLALVFLLIWLRRKGR